MLIEGGPAKRIVNEKAARQLFTEAGGLAVGISFEGQNPSLQLPECTKMPYFNTLFSMLCQ